MRDKHTPRVICVAASAGGLEALSAFTSVLSKDLSAPIVVAQHLSPTHRSLLTPLVARAASLPVVELVDGQDLTPGVIHIAPENTDVVLDGNRVLLSSANGAPGPHPSANKLFESAGKTWRERAVGVVLSGTGSDGADGASAIDDAGGVVFAQDADSSKYWSMPKAVVDRGLARAVLPPEMLAQAVEDLLRHGSMPAYEDANGEPEAIERLAEMTERDFDFGLMNYKPPTLQRRIGARMAATRCETIEDYCARVRDDPAEGRRLVDALLIPVTAFFRDGAAFDELRPIARQALARAAQDGSTFRVWCAGCCTGEEAYSLAILLDQESANLNQPPPIQIFATDVSDTFIEKARRGFFTTDQLLDAPQDTVASYFIQAPGGFRVVERLRERIVFAAHDIIRSTPFMNVDLVSCRNLLIYLKPEAQRAALSTMATALKPNGLLFLGRAETAGELPDIFEELSRHARLFRRTGSARLRLAPTGSNSKRNRATMFARREAAPDSDQDRLARYLMTRSSPTFLLDRNDQVLASYGDLTKLVTIAPGPFPSDIYGLLEEGVRVDVRSTLLACRRERRQRISRSTTPVGQDDQIRWRAIAEPAPGEQDSGEIILRFEESYAVAPPKREEGGWDSVVEDLSIETDDLREELAETRRQLRTVIEELEVSNEELQAANEELLSSNEEFQATNEELETTNEELQATNEELETVNDELTLKSGVIADLNEDLGGVLESLQSPLFVFDDKDALKSMNSAARSLMTKHGDGREVERLSDLRGLPSGGKIVQAAADLPGKGKGRRARRVRMGADELQARISSYGGGARAQRVILFQDVTELASAKRRAEEQRQVLEDLEVHQRALLDGITAQTALIDSTGAIIAINKAWRLFAEANGYQGKDFAIGENYLDICRTATGPCSKEASEVADNISAVLTGDKQEAVIDYPCHAPNEERWFQCVIRAVESQAHRAAVVMHVDNTRQVLWSRKLEEARSAEQYLSNAKSAFLANMSHELRTPLTAIIGFGDVMENEMFGPMANDKYRQYIHDIVGSAQHLLAIITEIIDFSRVDHGDPEGPEAPVDLRSTIDFAIEMTHGAYLAKNLQILFRNFDRPPFVIGDERLLRQVFINILSNAAKALPSEGRIDISTQIEPDGPLIIWIEDDGPGVPEEMLTRMFEPFEQGARTVEATPNSGLGLGLSIVTAILARHDGDIRAYNIANGGLGVEITFPFQRLATSTFEAERSEAG